jgi:PAS domain S-box-containing protein
MQTNLRSRLFRYGGAIAVVGIATVVRMLLDPVMLDKRPLVTYLAAVMFSAWAFGSGPTLLSAVLSVTAAMYFFVAPRYSFALDSTADQTGFLIFLVFGVVTAFFSEQLRRARERGEWRQRQHESAQALLESERRFRQLADAMPQIVWTIGPDGHPDYFNERWYEYTGLPKGLRGDDSWVPAFHPDDLERTRAAWAESTSSGSLYQMEYRIKNGRTGDYRWHLGRAVPGRNEAGKIMQWFGTSTDIDTQKRTLEKVRESERLYRAIGESIDYGVWVCDQDGKNVYASPSFLQLVGLTQEQCAEFGWGAVLHPDDAQNTLDAWKECVRNRGKWDKEHRFRGVDGAWHPILARGVPVEGEDGRLLCFAGINLDISRLKNAEQALQQAHDELERRVAERTRELTLANASLSREVEERRAAEARLREHAEEIETLMQVLPVPIWIARDPECRHMTGNLATYELTRVPLGGNVSKSAFKNEIPTTYCVTRDGKEVPPEELPMRRAAATGKEVRNAEFDFVFPDGSARSIFGFAAPLFAEGGRVRGCVGAFIDITERKRLEDSLRESEGRFQAFMDHLPAGAWILDEHSRCLFVNRLYSTMTGLDVGCIVGKTAYDLYPPEIAAEHQSNDRLALESGSGVELEEPYIRPDGTPGELLVVKFPIMERNQRLRIGGVALDVTERKRAEARMRRLATQLANAEDTERRRLASDLHDSIGQSLSLLKLGLDPLAAEHSALAAHLRMLDNIIRQTRTLMFELYPSMLHDLGLVPTLLWYSEQLARQAQVAVTETGKSSTLALPLASSLFRSAKELLGNAIRHGRAREVVVSVHWRPEVVKIVIDDDGCGFEPAKVLSSQTQRGLGLAGIRERLTSFGGKMSIESDPGRGTRIIMEVPVKFATKESLSQA